MSLAPQDPCILKVTVSALETFGIATAAVAPAAPARAPFRKRRRVAGLVAFRLILLVIPVPPSPYLFRSRWLGTVQSTANGGAARTDRKVFREIGQASWRERV